MAPLVPALLTLLQLATAPGTDGLTVGTVTASGTGTVRVPVYLKDTAATPIGADQPAGRRITGVSFQVRYGGSGCATTVAPYVDTSVPGSLLSAVSPDVIARPRVDGESQALIVSVSEGNSGGKGLPTSTAAADPGNLLGELVLSLNGCASDIPIQLDPSLSALTSDSSTSEKVSSAGLSLTDGLIRIAGGPTPRAQATLTVPAAASAHGLNDTFFHSDLWVMNLSAAAPVTVSARYWCGGGQACGGGPRSFELGPRQSRLFADAVASLFEAPESSGAIELSWDAAAGPVGARSRVYTPALPAPTSGAAVPAYAAGEARTRAVLLGLASHGGDLASGFRTNAGIFNPNDAEVTVTLRLRAADGTPLGTALSRAWGAREARQLNDVFAALGSAAMVTEGAYLEVTATLPVFAYATVVDNQSGDSVWVSPLDDPATPAARRAR